MNSYMIVLYRNSGYDNPVNVILTDCTAFANTGMTKHTQTVEGTTFEGYSGTPFSPSYANVTDGTVIAKNAPSGQQSIFIDGAEYYLRPNMKIVVSFKQSGTNISYSCDYYVGTTRLTAISDSYLFSNTLYYSLHIGAFKINDTIYYGFYLREDDRTFRVSTVSENYWDGSFNVTVKSPSKNATANSRVGMRSTASDVIEPGSAFNSLNVLAYGGTGLHVYKLSATQLAGLYHAMFSKNVLGSSDYKAYGLASGLLAMHYLPVDIPGTARNNIYINGLPLVNLRGTGYDMGGTEIAQQTYDTPWVYCRFDKDEFVSDSFLDFAPYVSATLTLPFVGTVSLDVNKVMYGEVRVRYIIDILSGNCLAEVYVTDLDGNPLFFNRYPGNCAYTIPIFANESGGFPILGLFEGIASAGLGIAGANEAVRRARKISQRTGFGHWAPPYAKENAQLKGVESVGGAIEDMANWEMNTAMIGSLPHNVSALAGNYCIFVSLTIKNSLTCLDDKGRDMLKALFGYSSAFYCKLSDLDRTGFVSGEFHADNVPKATEAEKTELEALLKEGVYL